MPYASVNEVPKNVPKSKRKQWLEVWNSIYNDTSNEQRAFAGAYAAIKPKKKAFESKLFKFGTKLTGFTDGVYGPFECGHCEYYDSSGDSGICTQDDVQKDDAVPEDSDGNKIVNFWDCCNEYEPIPQEKKEMLEAAKTAGRTKDEVSIFCPLVKVDSVKREVWGVVTAEELDKDGEICDYETTAPYYKEVVDEMSKATDGQNIFPLRAMHGLIAAGKGISIEFRDPAKEIYMGFKVVDDSEWKKVEENVYTGFSQGGRYIKRWKDGEVIRYTAKPGEVSLVDMPCLTRAHFSYVKSDGTTEIRKFSTKSEQPKLATRPVNGDDPVKYLIVEKNGDRHLPYTDSDGKVDPLLMRSAWDALHDGRYVKKYEGTGKQPAVKKLKQLYAKESLDNPAEKSERIESWLKEILEDVIQARAYGQLGKGMYTVSRFCYVLEDLKYLWMDLEYERSYENDSSPATDQVKGIVVSLLDAFLRYTEEQVDEARQHVVGFSLQ